MANSLLAHLYSRIKGSQEDVATISLQYLLSQSMELNKAFTSMLAKSLDIALADCLQYVCQVTGEGNERPDMAGIDADGRETVLCEMKFYAGLTQNQPITYIDRLKNEEGYGLAFVCPKAREINLWSKLRELCSDRRVEEVNERCIKVDGIHMSIITWGEVIERLRHIASVSATEYLSDISQLEGYCAQMDSEAFIPFREDELTAGQAKKAERYYAVVDGIIDRLSADEKIKTSLKGLKASAYRNGYTRSIYIDDMTLSINYDRNMWASNASVETPFWAAFRGRDWVQTDSLLNAMKKVPAYKKDDSLWKLTWLALEPLSYVIFEEVCDDLKRQIIEYYDLLRACE